MILAGIIGTAILIPTLLISLRWTRAILTGWLFFFVAIFPTLGVVGFTIVIAADKYAYLPSIGFLMILTAFLTWLCNAAVTNKQITRKIIMVLAILILAGIEAFFTHQHHQYWQNTEKLYKHMLALTPDVIPMLYNLANAIEKQPNRTNEVIDYYNRILELDPDYYRAHNNLGVALTSKGKTNEALKHYHRAIQIHPDFADPYYNLGNEFMAKGEMNQAINSYRQAIKLKPNYYQAHYNLGNSLKSQGKSENQYLEKCSDR